ncbi:WD40 repeat domain-containing protein [Thalassotalea ganghwensis]
MKQLLLALLILTNLASCSDPTLVNIPAEVTQRYDQKVIKAADISQDGQYTLLSNNESVCLWDNIANSKVYECIASADGQLIELLGISQSGQYFYTSNRINVHLYQLATGRLVSVWSAGDNIINDIALSADDSTILFGFRNGQASVVGVKEASVKTFDIHRLDINKVALSANGRLAFTGSADKTAKLWRTTDGDIKKSFEHQMRVNHVVLSNDGNMGFSLDAISDRFFWLLPSGKLFSELKSSVRFLEFNQSQFSPDKQWLLTGGPNKKLLLWRVTTGELAYQWQTYQEPTRQRSSVLSVNFIDNHTIASVTSDGVYQRWAIPKS